MKYSSDVLIVGAGTAGLMCALESAAQGLNVLLVEAATEIGGTLSVSAGHMSAAGTRRQQNLGILDHPDSHFDEVMTIGQGKADPALVRRAVDEAPAVIDWLEDHGFEFAANTPAIYPGHSAYSVPRTYWGVDHGRSILAILQRLIDQRIAEGLLQVHTDTRMHELVVEAGQVRGVLAGEHEFRAGVTVLATGGYGSNEELYKQLTPQVSRLVTNAIPTAQGDGHILARDLGAEIRFGEFHTPRLGLLERPQSPGRADFWTEMLQLDAFDGDHLWVNQLGERFIDETQASITEREHGVLKQPDSTFWVIFTESSLRGNSVANTWDDEQLHREAQLGEVAWTARNPLELARLAGIDVEGLSGTIAKSTLANLPAETPLYAIRSTAALLCSFGGITIDAEFQVLDNAGVPIPGLRAIGEILGMGATSGAAFCGGMAVTPALSFGRLLGRELGAAFQAR